MRVIVGGSRYCTRTAFIFAELSRLHAERTFTQLMQGGQRGVDYLAAQWARTVNLPNLQCRADWTTNGKAAGPIRNSLMLTWKPDLVVAFPGPQSKGTWDLVNKAKKAEIETIVIEL